MRDDGVDAFIVEFFFAKRDYNNRQTNSVRQVVPSHAGLPGPAHNGLSPRDMVSRDCELHASGGRQRSCTK